MTKEQFKKIKIGDVIYYSYREIHESRKIIHDPFKVIVTHLETNAVRGDNAFIHQSDSVQVTPMGDFVNELTTL